MKETGMILVLLVATASWGVAGEQPSTKRGEELFNSTRLGTNGKSCNETTDSTDLRSVVEYIKTFAPPAKP